MKKTIEQRLIETGEKSIDNAQPGYDFTNIIVLQNPKSKNVAFADERIATLEKLFPGKVDKPIDTHRKPELTRIAIVNRLTKEVEKGRRPIFAIAGGDGTVNTALESLVDPAADDRLRHIPLVPLGTGNANDLANMLFRDPTQLEEICTAGRTLDIHPLQVSIASPSGGRVRTLIAGCYVSFGASAQGAHKLNDPEVRRHAQSDKAFEQLLPDVFAMIAAVQAEPFTIEHAGKEYELREILFGNGDRAAKVGRMRARLDKPEIYTAMVRNRIFGRTALLRAAIQMIQGNLPGKLLEDESFSFVTRDTVPVQYDGETSYVLAGSTVTISHTDRAFRALSTRL